MQKKHSHTKEPSYLKLVVNRAQPLITEKPYAQVFYFLSEDEDVFFTFDNNY